MDGMSQRIQGASPDHQSYSKMSEPAASEGGWKVDRVDIRPVENGGYVVSCSKSRQGAGNAGGNGPASPGSSLDYQNKEYAFSSLPEAMAFVQSEFGDASGAEAATLGGGAADMGLDGEMA